jgi:ABC-type sugar transport system permease subunit
MIYPLVRSVVLSFCSTAGPGQIRFIGIGNYAFLLKDQLFWLAVGNTILYTVAFLSIQLPVALVLAILLNNKAVRFRNFFRFAFFSSHLVGGVFVAVLFGQILGTRAGMLNQLLGLFTDQVPQINWLGNPWLARASVLMAWLWLSLGYAMIYMLAALQSVDQELYEAASVDGAGKMSQFWHVTIPGIRPVLTFMLLVGIIGSFQLFELPFVLLNGTGPSWSGLTIVSYLFSTAFSTGDLGYASAIGWALVSMLLVISILQLKLTGATRKT